MHIIAVDPGTRESGVAVVDPTSGKPLEKHILGNYRLREFLREYRYPEGFHLTVERFQMYKGKSGKGYVGDEVFDSCIWIGRFMEQTEFCRMVSLVPRWAIKVHHTGQVTSTDAMVRQAIVNKYGDKGTKKKPGPMYGFTSHMWQAFALGSYVQENPKWHTAKGVWIENWQCREGLPAPVQGDLL